MYQYGSFLQRLAASLIDGCLFWIPLLILTFVFRVQLQHNSTPIQILGIVVMLYNIIFVWRFGATIGKKLLGLKVVDDDYQKISFGKVLVRESVGKVISGLTGLGYLWVLIDKKRQAWHDKLAGTVVIRVNKVGQPIQLPVQERISTAQKIVFGVGCILIILQFIIVMFTIVYIVFRISPLYNQLRSNSSATPASQLRFNPNDNNPPGWKYYVTQSGQYGIKYPPTAQLLIGQSVDILTRQKTPAIDLNSLIQIISDSNPNSQQKFTLAIFNQNVSNQADLKYLANTTNICTEVYIPSNQNLNGSQALYYTSVSCGKYFMPLLVYTIHNNIFYAITVYGIGDNSLNRPNIDQILSTFRFLN